MATTDSKAPAQPIRGRRRRIPRAMPTIARVAGALALTVGPAVPAAAHDLYLVGIFCSQESNDFPSNSDEIFVVVTVYDNNTGDILVPPTVLPQDVNNKPTYWGDVDAGEFRNNRYHLWSGSGRNLLIDTQVWEYDSHLAGALRVLIDLGVAIGVEFATENPYGAAAAGVVADRVADRIFRNLESADHDFLGRAQATVSGADLPELGSHRHYHASNDSGDRLDYDFSVETQGKGADYMVFFEIDTPAAQPAPQQSQPAPQQNQPAPPPSTFDSTGGVAPM